MGILSQYGLPLYHIHSPFVNKNFPKNTEDFFLGFFMSKTARSSFRERAVYCAYRR